MNNYMNPKNVRTFTLFINVPINVVPEVSMKKTNVFAFVTLISLKCAVCIVERLIQIVQWGRRSKNVSFRILIWGRKQSPTGFRNTEVKILESTSLI